jgi:hypothetical protein
MKIRKVLVTGAFNSGKTAFVRTGSDIDVVTTERYITDTSDAKVKDETTVALDYGQARVDDTLLHLYGTPGQDRFDFMRLILSRDTDAFILILDSEDRSSWMEAIQILRTLKKQHRVPFLVAANKQDGQKAFSPSKIAASLSLSDDVPVIPCVARDEESVRTVLQEVVALLS